MDECDHASAWAETWQKKALENVLERDRPCGDSRSDCIDCGEDIPEGRRKAVPGCVRCVKCEADLERNGM